MEEKIRKEVKKIIKEKVKKILKEKKKKGRGRPKKYKEWEIIYLMIIKTIEKLSYRKLEKRGKDYLKKAPNYTTIQKRIKEMDEELLKKIIEEIGREIEKKLKGRKRIMVIADGTGFGYDGKWYIKEKIYIKGKIIKIKEKEVKSHVKVELIIGIKAGKRYLKAIEVALPYSDERKMLKKLLNNHRLKPSSRRKVIFLADSFYGKDNLLLEKLISTFDLVIVKIKDTPRQPVISKIRQKVQQMYLKNKHIYKKRFHIEAYIGNVKSSFGSWINVKTFACAKNFVLVNFLLFSILQLLSLSS